MMDKSFCFILPVSVALKPNNFTALRKPKNWKMLKISHGTPFLCRASAETRFLATLPRREDNVTGPRQALIIEVLNFLSKRVLTNLIFQNESWSILVQKRSIESQIVTKVGAKSYCTLCVYRRFLPHF